MALTSYVLNQKHGFQDLTLFLKKPSIRLYFLYLHTLAKNSQYEWIHHFAVNYNNFYTRNNNYFFTYLVISISKRWIVIWHRHLMNHFVCYTPESPCHLVAGLINVLLTASADLDSEVNCNAKNIILKSQHFHSLSLCIYTWVSVYFKILTGFLFFVLQHDNCGLFNNYDHCD